MSIATGARWRSPRTERSTAASRVKADPAELELFARSLAADDQVVLEATFGAAKIAEIIKPHVGRVVVADPRRLAKADSRKTDRRDARKLAELLAAGFLDEVWTPDEATRSLRRLVARRASVVKACTRAKNEVHAALARNLCPRPPMKDAFGKAGRRWLAGIELPEEEQVSVNGCLRQVDFLAAELAELDRVLARFALRSPEVRRLMTVPGVNMVTAIGFLASVGDIRRFPTPRKLVGYLGLDPRVRQSGESAARHGRISKAGSASARHVLSESAWSVAMTRTLKARQPARVDVKQGAWSRPLIAPGHLPRHCWTRREPVAMKDLPDRRAGPANGAGEPARPEARLPACPEDRLLLGGAHAPGLAVGSRGAITKPLARGKGLLAHALAAVPPSMGRRRRHVEGGSCRPQRLAVIDELAEREPACRSESSVSVNLHPGPP